MGTKKHNISVLTLSAITAGLIFFFQWKSQHSSPYKSSVYPVAGGWGYDILVNDSLFIHQESIPALEGNKPFTTKVQAMAAASQLISKLQKGKSPSFSPAEIERIRLIQ